MHSFLKKQKSFGETRCRKVLNAIRKVRFTKSTPRQASIWEKKGPSLGKTKVVPRQRSPYAPKFEDRSHEETGRQQRCAQSKAWNLAKSICMFKEKDRATFFSPTKKWVLPSASSRESCEREFVVDSGASMHMVSEKDLDSAELATMKTSRSPTTVMTANCEVRTNKEATIYVKQLDFFVKVTLAVLFLRKLCDEHGYTYHWKAVRIHISSNMARELIAIYITMYHLWFLESQLVLPQLRLHLPRHHLHHRSQHRPTVIQYRKTEMLPKGIQV